MITPLMISFRLIEKMDDAFRGSRGKGLQPPTLEVFEDLGIVDRIAAAGGPYPPQREYGEDGIFTESAVAESGEPRTDEPYRSTLLGYEVERSAVAPCYGLRIHTFGSRGDVVDHSDYVRQAYALTPGSWVLVRPNGYVGALVSTEEIVGLEEYLRNLGLE